MSAPGAEPQNRIYVVETATAPSTSDKACYENPLFEEDGTVVNDTQTKIHRQTDGLRSKPYELPNAAQTSVHYKQSKPRKRKGLCIVGVVLTAIVVIAIIAAVMVGQRDGSTNEQSMPGNKRDVLYRTNYIDGRVRINQGPFSTYKPDYKDNTSVTYSFFSSPFTYQMDLIITRSDFSTSYTHTEIVNISSGSVIVDFILHFRSYVDIYRSTAKVITDIIIEGMDSSLFVIDKTSVRIQPRDPSLSVITTPQPGVCVPLLMPDCINVTDWSKTTYPNVLGHRGPQEVADAHMRYQELFLNLCGKDFWCTVFNPRCKNSRGLPPCREYCKVVYSSCQYELDVNRILNCDDLPDSSDPNVCTQDPFKPGKCITNTEEKCKSYGFDEISFPNFATMRSKYQALEMISVVEGIYQSTKCYKYSMLFGCAAFMPKCSGTEKIASHAIPPCRSLCNAYKTRCSVFMDIFWYPWPDQLYCDSFPDEDDPNICIGYKEAREIPEIEACPAGEDKCDNDTCIPLSWKCDGYSDCEDGSDEAALQTTLPLRKCVDCPDDMFRCSFGSAVCIEGSRRCDGIEDCPTGSDEKECVKLEDGRHGLLTVYNPDIKDWTPVCSTGWETENSNRVCAQLGFTNRISQETVNLTSSRYFTLMDSPRNGTNTRYISGQLKSENTCGSGLVMKITCGNAVCGIRPAFVPPALRVVGGDIADPNAWPWHVSFFGGTDEKYFCGGTIIDEMWILTAGHCIGGRKEPKDLLLRAGQPRRDTFSKYEQELHPAELFLHENYEMATVDNDIALIKLDKPIKFNDHVRPACLPKSEERLRTGTRCTVYGWGKQGDNAIDYERQIREVNLEVTDWDQCNGAIEQAKLHTPVPYKLTKHMFCAGGGVGHDSCAGDSGGAYLCPTDATKRKWYIGGIVSWGVACALDNVPGIYTNVPGYLDWIKNKTGLNYL